MLYLPKLWWHSVLNLDDVVIGITVQDSEKTLGWPSVEQKTVMSSNYYSLGFEQFENNNMKQAIEYFEKCLSLDPTFIHCYLLLARIYWFAYDELDKAERLLRIAYVLNPYSMSVQNGLVGLFIQTNKLQMVQMVRNNLPLPVFDLSNL